MENVLVGMYTKESAGRIVADSLTPSSPDQSNPTMYVGISMN